MKLLNFWAPFAGGLWLIPVILMLAATYSFFRARSRDRKGNDATFAYLVTIILVVAAVSVTFFMMSER